VRGEAEEEEKGSEPPEPLEFGRGRELSCRYGEPSGASRGEGAAEPGEASCEAEEGLSTDCSGGGRSEGEIATPCEPSESLLCQPGSDELLLLPMAPWQLSSTTLVGLASSDKGGSGNDRALA